MGIEAMLHERNSEEEIVEGRTVESLRCSTL